MTTTAALRVVATLATLASASVAYAGTPQEDIVRRWLDSVAFGLPVSIGASSFDPASQTVTLSDVSIGEAGTNLVRFQFDELDVEDPREAPHGAFAAHAIRGTNYRVDVHFDVAQWFPALSARPDETTAAATTEPQTSHRKPAGVAPDGRAASHDGKSPTPKTEAPSEEPAPDAAAASEPPPVVDYTLTAETLLIERPVMPTPPAPLGEDRPLYERLFHMAGWMTDIRADWVELDSARVETDGIPEGDTVTTYSMAYMSGVHEGRVERAGVNSVEQTPKNEDAVLKSMSIDSSYIIGMDVGAAIEALDPARYQGGKGDGKARVVYSQYGVNNLAFAFEGGSAKLANIEANNVYLRQTEQPVVKLVADALSDPKAIENDPIAFVTTVLPNYTQLFGVDYVEASGFEVKTGDDFELGIRQFDGNSLDAGGLGAITLRDISANAKSAGIRTSLSLLTLQDIHFGWLAPLLELGRSASEGGEPSGEAVREALTEGSSSIGFLEIGTLSVDTPLGGVGLDSLAITSGDYLKALPQRADLTFTSLSLPVGLLTDESVVKELSDMGYETLDMSGGMTMTWDARLGDLRLEDLTLKANDMGRLSADFHIAGLPLSLIDKPDEIEARLNDAKLVGASITYGNGGIVEKAFEAQGKKLNQDGDTFRKNTAGALPLMLAFLDDKELQTRFAGPIADFLRDPKSIRLVVAPEKPVAFSELEAVDTGKPGALIKLLNVDVTANQ